MSNTRSAAKKIRQNAKRRLRNRGVRGYMRSQIRKFRELLKDENTEDAGKMLGKIYSVIDRTARKGVIHSNTAARYKSRLTKHFNNLVS